MLYARVNIGINTKISYLDKLKPELWGKYLGLPYLLGNKWDALVSFRHLSKIAQSY